MSLVRLIVTWSHLHKEKGNYEWANVLLWSWMRLVVKTLYDTVNVVPCSFWYLNSHCDLLAILVIWLCWIICIQKEANLQKLSRRSRDERPYLNADDISGINDAEQSQSIAFKSFGTQRKNAKGFMGTLKDQQVWKDLFPLIMILISLFMRRHLVGSMTTVALYSFANVYWFMFHTIC